MGLFMLETIDKEKNRGMESLTEAMGLFIEESSTITELKDKGLIFEKTEENSKECEKTTKCMA